MAKKDSSFLKLVLSLSIVTVVAASALAAVYGITKDPIDQSKLNKKNNAIKLVQPGFDTQKGVIKEVKVLPEGESDSLTVYISEWDNAFFGAAVETYTNMAFSGRFEIMVGFDKEGKIMGTEVLKANETPGLGDKIDKKKDNFPLQFNGKNPGTMKLKVKKDGGDIDAITAATISSKAFCDAVDRAFKAFQIVVAQYESQKSEPTQVTSN